jgi:tellurite resistance protein TerC
MFIWCVFLLIVILLMAFDLKIGHKKNQEPTFNASIKISIIYIIIALIFGLWIWYIKGVESFAEYITGFLIEKSLALDNIFLISLIFANLSIPPKYQHRVLFWGILSVIILRAIMIGLGAHIIAKFEWMLFIFAAFMILTGFKMLFVSHKPIDISKNIFLIWLKKHLNITNELHDQKFYIYKVDSKTGIKKLFFTPLFISLVMIEIVDIVFAVDSIPAIFAITTDPYIVYTSNIFAILGLRALYFALASIIERFYYLKYSLAVVLIFIGSKMFIADALGIAKIPPTLSLLVTSLILAFGMLYSYIHKPIKK